MLCAYALRLKVCSLKYCFLKMVVMIAIASMAAGCISHRSDARHDSWAIRVEALALIETLNADLLSHDSATATLERWCDDHRLAAEPRIIARRSADAAKTIPDSLRDQLQLSGDEPLVYRRVQLVCGARILSEADNWYVPSRLTADMNRRLNSTDEPFGKVVRPLNFQRRTLSAELLWRPLPAGWDVSATPANPELLHIPHALLRHQALLTDVQQKPFSVLIETYTSEVLAFGRLQRFVNLEQSH